MQFNLAYEVLLLYYIIAKAVSLKCHCTNNFSRFDGLGEYIPCVNNTCDVDDEDGGCMILTVHASNKKAFRCVKNYTMNGDCENFIQSFAMGTTCRCNSSDFCNLKEFNRPKETEPNELIKKIRQKVRSLKLATYGNSFLDDDLKAHEKKVKKIIKNEKDGTAVTPGRRFKLAPAESDEFVVSKVEEETTTAKREEETTTVRSKIVEEKQYVTDVMGGQSKEVDDEEDKTEAVDDEESEQEGEDDREYKTEAEDDEEGTAEAVKAKDEKIAPEEYAKEEEEKALPEDVEEIAKAIEAIEQKMKPNENSGNKGKKTQVLEADTKPEQAVEDKADQVQAVDDKNKPLQALEQATKPAQAVVSQTGPVQAIQAKKGKENEQPEAAQEQKKQKEMKNKDQKNGRNQNTAKRSLALLLNNRQEKDEGTKIDLQGFEKEAKAKATTTVSPNNQATKQISTLPTELQSSSSSTQLRTSKRSSKPPTEPQTSNVAPTPPINPQQPKTSSSSPTKPQPKASSTSSTTALESQPVKPETFEEMQDWLEGNEGKKKNCEENPEVKRTFLLEGEEGNDNDNNTIRISNPDKATILKLTNNTDSTNSSITEILKDNITEALKENNEVEELWSNEVKPVVIKLPFRPTVVEKQVNEDKARHQLAMITRMMNLRARKEMAKRENQQKVKSFVKKIEINILVLVALTMLLFLCCGF
ncbi:unnamed protein product [Bursaphelenchus okinawaensis]|uniref:Uncharacterized protein n=1 Tax=Bursaphelenchus okinawaensis TaxID=465554 RepID=A0A811LGF4_9BILA|nr:unnamed protein product [Bursaphelenchus okinawaensis]CAG9121965.1 unnamed protein product [Bursaphelenchus okinawaensis]